MHKVHDPSERRAAESEPLLIAHILLLDCWQSLEYLGIGDSELKNHEKIVSKT